MPENDNWRLDVAWDDRAAARLASLTEFPQAYWSRRSDLEWN